MGDPIRSDFSRPDLPLFVVSAVAAVSGGPLSVLQQAVSAARRFGGANFLFLIHEAGSLGTGVNVRFLSFPWARRSAAHRICAEYLWFPVLSRRWRPDVWLSLLDTTPPVCARRQAVYCQNPLPYWSPTLGDLRLQSAVVVRSALYGLVFKAFAGRNDFVIGQLPWYTEFIGRYMGVPRRRLLVAAPQDEPSSDTGVSALESRRSERLECVYVSMPRVFKNFEEAIDLCDQPDVGVSLTLSGTENRYARHVRAYARSRGRVKFLGQLAHPDCLATMAAADVVLFPSRLETFGLPIREGMDLGRTLVLPVRPWTVEIAGTYAGAYFYRSVSQGRAILRSLADGNPPETWEHPSPAATDLPRVSGFGELYAWLLR